MFIGHYGPAAATAGRRVKLWHGFVAVQFLDILWAPFVLLGIEHARIVENFTASNHFDLYHMPYTHSLVMAVFWSFAVGVVYRLLRGGGGALIGALVFSHWLFDFVTHKPDLELWFGGPKVGLGLWDNRPLAIGTEFALAGLGLLIFTMRHRSKGAGGWAMLAFTALIMIAAQVYGNFGPPPANAAMAAQSAIVAYVIFAALAFAIDATHEPHK